jgi:hypothetical protein
MRQLVYRMYSDDVSIYAVREKKHVPSSIVKWATQSISIVCVCVCVD